MVAGGGLPARRPLRGARGRRARRRNAAAGDPAPRVRSRAPGLRSGCRRGGRPPLAAHRRRARRRGRAAADRAADLREPHAAQRRGDRRVRRGVGHRASQGALGRRARAPARAQVAPVPALVGLRAGAGRRRLGHEGAQRPARGPAPARRAEGRQGARRGRAPPSAGVRAGGPRRRGGLDRLAHAAGARGLRAPRGRARALRGRGRPRALRPARRAAARPRDAGAAAPAGRLRQPPAGLRRQAPGAHPARRAPRRRLRAAQPADPPQLPDRRARRRDLVDRGQTPRGDAHPAPARAPRPRDAQ